MSATFVLVPLGLASILPENIRLFSIENKDSIIIQTKMTDETLLNRALTNYSQSLPQSERAMFSKEFQMENKRMEFRRNKEYGNFEAVFNNFSKEDAKQLIEDLYSEYTLFIQERVYKRVLDKLEEKDLTLDNEEILEDNSIVLTVGING